MSDTLSMIPQKKGYQLILGFLGDQLAEIAVVKKEASSSIPCAQLVAVGWRAAEAYRVMLLASRYSRCMVSGIGKESSQPLLA